ncbi:hypothetical protein [Mucilaginibacter segetis]|uniref:Outer membrane protein beta-barrel domain-containing protein n=1 Tax=Mucilaginibacter segetis TaxID=2793071 RepID=A0A934PSK1_9SPHI|nr:hypothetical protein [Mucilaginibacter segetis]MBK0378260.1 hypothetical protein [Mucilaginibacter segetis]
MTIKILPIALIFALTTATYVKAQKISPSQSDSIPNPYVNKKAQTVFFELLGPGALYSLNYDTRFNKRQDGLGGRVGISYYADSGDNLFTIPVVLNYLLGKNGKYFEVGIGATYYIENHVSTPFFGDNYEYTTDTNGNYYYNRSNNSGVLGTLNFGYRYQPADGGFAFRAGVSPIFNTHGFAPYWPYISFGYAF